MATEPRRGRRRRRPLIVIGAFVIAGVLAHGIWGIVEQRRLIRALAALRAAGEPTTPADLEAPGDDTPDEDNASVVYKRAAAMVDAASPAWGAYFGSQFVGAPATWPPSATERGAMVELCRSERPTLAIVTAARGRPAGDWHEPFVPADRASFAADWRDRSAVGELCDLILADAALGALAGNDDAVIGRLADAVALSDAAERRPGLRNTLAAEVTLDGSCRAVSELMPRLAVTPARRPGLHRLLSQLSDERAVRSGAQLGWRGERVAVVSLMADMAVGRLRVHVDLPEITPVSPIPIYLFRPTIVRDARCAAAELTAVAAAAEADDWPAARGRWPVEFPAAVKAGPVLHLAAYLLVPPYELDVRAEYLALSERRLAAVAVAARLFAADHAGRPPTAWADLVPAYLPAVPVDAVDGRPVRIADGPPRAWVVGFDEQDDGGVPVDPTKPGRPRGDEVAFFAARPSPTTRPAAVGR